MISAKSKRGGNDSEKTGLGGVPAIDTTHNANPHTARAPIVRMKNALGWNFTAEIRSAYYIASTSEVVTLANA